MLLAIGDYVYVPSLRVYGRIEDIGEGEETFYTVDPIWFKLARPRTNFYRGEKED